MVFDVSDILAVIHDIPDHFHYLTVDELRGSLHRIAEEYPAVVNVHVAEVSRKGEPIEYMEIGYSNKAVLVYALAHPDEPIGSLVVDYLMRKLATNSVLRRALDCRWILIPCIDPDGTRLNEGWFKDHLNTVARFRNHYSPPGNKSTDFAFPADENFDINDVPATTRALMRVIDQYRPQTICTLHNIPFAGAHWYINRDLPTLFDALYELSGKTGISINMGEPFYTDDEAFRPGIYRITGNADKNAKTIHISAYYRRKMDGLFMVPEVPLYYCQEIADLSDSGKTKRDVRVAAEKLSLGNIEFLNGFWCELKDKLNAESVFFPGLHYWLENAPTEIEKDLAELGRNAKYDAPASVSEASSHEIIRSHNRCYILGNFLRLLNDSTPTTDDERRQWQAIAAAIEQRIFDIDKEVRRGNALIFPRISDLVQLQAASVLLAVQHSST